MKENGFFLNGEAVREPLLYKGCGLAGIYLLNGYDILHEDGEQSFTVTDVDGLHKTIGCHIVTHRKGLSPKEVKFLRNTMGLTQSELADRLGNNSQSVARWEKGECEISGTAEKLLRAVFFASFVHGDDIVKLKELLEETLSEFDELQASPAQFELFDKWLESGKAA